MCRRSPYQLSARLINLCFMQLPCALCKPRRLRWPVCIRRARRWTRWCHRCGTQHSTDRVHSNNDGNSPGFSDYESPLCKQYMRYIRHDIPCISLLFYTCLRVVYSSGSSLGTLCDVSREQAVPAADFRIRDGVHRRIHSTVWAV